MSGSALAAVVDEHPSEEPVASAIPLMWLPVE